MWRTFICVSLEQGSKRFIHIFHWALFCHWKKIRNYMFHRLSIKMLLLIYAQDGFLYFDWVGHMIMPIINQIKTLIKHTKSPTCVGYQVNKQYGQHMFMSLYQPVLLCSLSFSIFIKSTLWFLFVCYFWTNSSPFVTNFRFSTNGKTDSLSR